VRSYTDFRRRKTDSKSPPNFHLILCAVRACGSMEANYYTPPPETLRILCVEYVSTFAKRILKLTIIIVWLTLSIDRCYAQDSNAPPDQPANQRVSDTESAGQLLGQLEDIKTIDVKERVDDQLIVSRINNILTASDWFGD